MDAVQLAAVLAAVVVVASMLSVELGISVALLELGLGVVVGNLFHLDANVPWLTFVASFASIVLTFLAGAEVDPADFRERFGASVSIGLVSFAGPFAVAWPVSWLVLGWTLKASLIAGTALSTTSLAVVYAVLVETGLNGDADRQADHERVLRHRHGDRAGALGHLHHAQRVVPALRCRLGGGDRRPAEDRALVLPALRRPVIEPEIKLVFVVLFALMVVGHRGHFLGDYLLGSTADRVAHHAHCPVMVVR